jgi:hypothetical protein
MQNNPPGPNDPTYIPQPPPPQYTQYPQTPYPPPPMMQPPPKKRRPWLWIIVGIVALIIFYQIGQAAFSQTSTSTPPAGTSAPSGNTPAATQPPAPTPTPTPSFANFGDGTYQVGKDIKAGTYRTRIGSPGCYYARLKGFGGSIDDIIANDNTDAPAVVTIKASDKGFMSQNCGTWTKDLSQITTSKTSFDDGIFIVGTDIKPGTYKDTGGDSCYYARLRGFGGTIDDIITNNNVSAPTIVTISSSDKGFQSKGCGTWTKQ